MRVLGYIAFVFLAYFGGTFAVVSFAYAAGLGWTTGRRKGEEA